MVYRLDDGGHASFQSIETNNNTTSEDHLGVTFGISVGCPLWNASVTGGYDRDLLENRDGATPSFSLSNLLTTTFQSCFQLPSCVALQCMYLADMCR